MRICAIHLLTSLLVVLSPGARLSFGAETTAPPAALNPASQNPGAPATADNPGPLPNRLLPGAADAAVAPAAGSMPGVGFSLLRLFGALVLVLSLFLAGVWLFKHWQRLAIARGGTPRLKLLEIKPLGHRHALYVVGYEQQRLLIASSPTGVTLLTQLPEGTANELSAPAAPPGFAEALRHVLAAKS